MVRQRFLPMSWEKEMPVPIAHTARYVVLTISFPAMSFGGLRPFRMKSFGKLLQRR